MTQPPPIFASRAFVGDALCSNVLLHTDDSGRIASIETDVPAPPAGTLDRSACLLLPGFVNAHSHAFQRGLRRVPQRFSGGQGSFWTWRDSMYALVDELDVDRCYELSRMCFDEMLACGITTVGEFHYVHHDSPHDWALDRAVLRAAYDAGIRLVLLQTAYLTGGIDAPLAGAQSRFDGIGVKPFLARFDAVRSMLHDDRQSIGLALHSIRALPIDAIRELVDWANTQDVVTHMHLEEQRQELAACRKAYDTTPLRLLLDQDLIGSRFTAVHCTHSSPLDLSDLLARGAHVCLCPLTEGNLADGFPDTPSLGTTDQVCFGSDCNLRVSMLDELRMLEFGHRVNSEKTGCFTDRDGRCAEHLLSLATRSGANALGVECGTLTVGHHADCVAIDLSDISLRGWSDEGLIDNVVFGAHERCISEVWVGGRSVYSTSS